MSKPETSQCCGAPKVRVSGLWLCSKCRRSLRTSFASPGLSSFERLSRDYDRESFIGDMPGRQDREIKF